MDRLEKGEYHTSFPDTILRNLETLYIDYNDFMLLRSASEDCRSYLAENQAMVTLLKHFKRLSFISNDFGFADDTMSHEFEVARRQIDNLLRMNYSGIRFLLPSACEGVLCEHPIPIVKQRKNAAVPISLWPHILERADKDPLLWSFSKLRLDPMEYKEMSEISERKPDAFVIYKMLRPNAHGLGSALDGVLDANSRMMDKKRKATDVAAGK